MAVQLIENNDTPIFNEFNRIGKLDNMNSQVQIISER
jgi:hypothetical protein